MAARGAGKKAAPKRKGGYKMPPPMPSGEVLTDIPAKKKWRLGPSVGVGGFGEIYSACDDSAAPKSSANYPYAVKIEPHENGPLFVEKNFYCRNSNKEDISNYIKSNKLPGLGMPVYHGGGSHTYKGDNYRYLVLERYGKDVWSIFLENNKQFSPVIAFQIGLQMLDVLEYIHSRGYVHADLKGSNILLGLKKGSENQTYLLDYGLAKKVTENDFKPDPKWAHNGTIEYTSRDAHLGAPTLRGDLEILAYNMLHWITGALPWEKAIQDPKRVQQMKEDFMSNVPKNIKNPEVPGALIEFFEYVNKLKPSDVPDFTKCKKIFDSYLKSQGISRTSKLEFGSKSAKVKPVKSKSKTKVVDEDIDSENTDTPVKKTKKVTTNKRKSNDSLLVSVKKKKLNTTSNTPPAKPNHNNISTQTSTEKSRKSPRLVTFDSPVVSEVIVHQSRGRSAKIPDYRETSPDMFEGNSKRKLIAKKTVTVKRKIVKKTTVKIGKSWRDAPAIVNGKSPIS